MQQGRVIVHPHVAVQLARVTVSALTSLSQLVQSLNTSFLYLSIHWQHTHFSQLFHREGSSDTIFNDKDTDKQKKKRKKWCTVDDVHAAEAKLKGGGGGGGGEERGGGGRGQGEREREREKKKKMPKTKCMSNNIPKMMASFSASVTLLAGVSSQTHPVYTAEGQEQRAIKFCR